MKQVKTTLLVFLVLVGFNSGFAQDKNYPWAIKLGVNAIDYHPTNFSGNLNDEGTSSQWFDEFFNFKDHYNMIPTISSLSIGRYLTDGFSLELGANVNKITKIGNNPEINPGDLALLNIDLGVKYALQNLVSKQGWFDPYLLMGGGYTLLDWKGTGTLNGGLGINLWISKSVAFNVQTQYKHAFDNLYNPYFQHNAGFTIKFGRIDTDKDGIYDDEDDCPTVFGLKEFNGCPDTDNDGIRDIDDDCPNVPGDTKFNGCPDADKDGVKEIGGDYKGAEGNYDKCLNTPEGCKVDEWGCPLDTDKDGVIDCKDNCPDTKIGCPVDAKGCPLDTDGDGVIDCEDNCPNTPANCPVDAKGCPLDTDADGVIDCKDKCPDTPKGTAVDADGCPIITIYGITLFDTGSAKVIVDRKGKNAELDAVLVEMKKDQTAEFIIEGHTDTDGVPDYDNQKLSEDRAKAVVKYFVKKGGFDKKRLTSLGSGYSKPIDTNETEEGKAKNRRVEISLKK